MHFLFTKTEFATKAVVGSPAMAWPLFCHEIFLLFFATRGEIFCLKFTKYRSAAGLCPDPLGKVKGPHIP